MGGHISIHAIPHPSNPALTRELQLKGAGQTPFSYSADGLAVLWPPTREYLCSGAMYIPTKRVFSIVSRPALSVERERTETVSVVTRTAPSFIHIGCFEAHNVPTNMLFGGGWQQNLL